MATSTHLRAVGRTIHDFAIVRPMLSEDDISLIVSATEDPSAEVRETAKRLLAVLVPLVREGPLQERFSSLIEREQDDEFDRALEALSDAARQEPDEIANSVFGRRDNAIDEEMEVDALEQARRVASEEADVSQRFWAALTLAGGGECDWIERILDDLESGPVDTDLLRKVRKREPWTIQPACAHRLLQIAKDTKRRGDVRQIGWLIGHASVEESAPPETPDLTEMAEEIVDHCLSSEPIVAPAETELLRFLDREHASMLIIALFEACLSRAPQEQGYMEGNEIVTLVADLEDKFCPDIEAFLQLYIQAFQTCSETRKEWYKTRDDNLHFFAGSGCFSISWQIAWTVSRAGLLDIISGLATFLESAEERERIAAFALLEDAIRLSQSGPPLFGGVSERPNTNSLALVEELKAKLPSDSVDEEYRRVRVFYGTNRKATGSNKPSQWYGREEGEFELGECEVTIPREHDIAKLESPSWHTVIHRQDPSRYIILQSIQPQTQPAFCESLRSCVNSSKNKQALIFVHGYRVSFEDAARRTAQLAIDLRLDIPLFFSWPSKVRLLGYGADVTIAERAVPAIIRFLNLITEKSGVEVVHLIAHSMGAFALSNALVDYLGTRKRNTKPVFREIILAAPDIDEVVFKEQIVPKILNKGSHLTLYASRRDYALLCSRGLRLGLSRAGLVRKGRPAVVMKGVETIDVSAVNDEFACGLVQGHSYVSNRTPVLQDLFELLQSGRRAGDRFGNEEASLGGLPYWIMKRRVA